MEDKTNRAGTAGNKIGSPREIFAEAVPCTGPTFAQQRAHAERTMRCQGRKAGRPSWTGRQAPADGAAAAPGNVLVEVPEKYADAVADFADRLKAAERPWKGDCDQEAAQRARGNGLSVVREVVYDVLPGRTERFVREDRTRLAPLAKGADGTFEAKLRLCKELLGQEDGADPADAAAKDAGVAKEAE